tara:strand:- start:1411 stop:1830 length:420 start_codon:yes stop_codon:yes gene_type:complete
MNHYLLGLGSNINPEENLPRARAALAGITDVITISPVVDTPAVGDSFNYPFQNQLMLVCSPLESTELKQQLLDIEEKLGREPKCEARKFKDRTIDIDILGEAQSREDCIQFPLDESYYLSAREQWQLSNPAASGSLTSG